MNVYLDASWLRILSGLCVNLSAASYAIIFVISDLARPVNAPFNLTANILFGTLYLLLAAKLDRLIKKHD